MRLAADALKKHRWLKFISLGQDVIFLGVSPAKAEVWQSCEAITYLGINLTSEYQQIKELMQKNRKLGKRNRKCCHGQPYLFAFPSTRNVALKERRQVEGWAHPEILCWRWTCAGGTVGRIAGTMPGRPWTIVTFVWKIWGLRFRGVYNKTKHR